MKTIIVSSIISFLLLSNISFAGIEIKSSREKTGDKDLKKEIYNKVEMAFNNSEEIVVVDAINDVLNAIPEDTKNSFSQVLYYPDFAKSALKEDLVAISFTYDEDGYIKVLSSNASNPALNDYIKDKLENVRLKNGSVTIGKAYNAKFHFKLL